MDLQVRAPRGKVPERDGCITVMFGTKDGQWLPCIISKGAADNPRYLASLINFMRHQLGVKP